MSLEISFTIQKMDLLLGEDTDCRLLLKNQSQETLMIDDPKYGGMPFYRVVNLDTGAEMLRKTEPVTGKVPFPVEIPPGEIHEAWTSLHRIVKWPAPGKYAISAVYFYGTGKEKIETEPILVSVRAVAVRNLFLDFAHGDAVNGVFINSAAETPDVVMARFAIIDGGGLKTIEQLGKGTILSRPIKSIPPNTQGHSGEWVAWTDANILHFINWDKNESSALVGKIKITGTNPDIISPLYIDPTAPGVEHGNGAVLLWTDADTSEGTALSAIKLLASNKNAKAQVEGNSIVHGPRPIWSMSYARSDCSRHLVYLQSREDKLALASVPWPSGRAAIQSSPLQEWSGDFVAAGATLTSDDALRGAVLIWTGKSESRKLELIGWILDNKGELKEHYRETIPWNSSTPISDAVVKVRITGLPAVLLRRLETEWVIFDAFGKMMDIPAPYNNTMLPIDFVFFGLQEVVLICAELTGGFSVKRMDGSELPPYIK